MRKRRKSHPQEDGNPPKRPRVVHETPTSEEVHTARQLKKLLAFDQDVGRARHGLQSFKLLLDGLNDEAEGERGSDALAVLTEYLSSSTPKEEGDDEAVYLPEIMDTWSFAAQTRNDNLLSMISADLALLLKVISQVLELRSCGLGICRTLLQKRQLELVAGNLSADKSKEFIISPTLRLVREVLCFDGGALARLVFRARAHTFRALARNLTLRFRGDGLEDAKRPAVRTHAVRFFLSSLKLLHAGAKAELLSQRDVVGAVTKGINDDAPYLIFEILDGLKSTVLLDKELPRVAKSKALNATALGRLSSLYSYRHGALAQEEAEAEAGRDARPVDEAAHQFLMLACTSPKAGTLRRQSGFYPKGVDADGDAAGDVDLDRVAWMDRFTQDVPVENAVLAQFVQGLRPWSSTKHGELLLGIFAAAPELVAWYFLAKRSFTFEPKLSVTWIGYAALLFNTIRLPLPPHLGHASGFARVPPPPSITADNILPPPLTQKVLVRCLLHDAQLVRFFALRLLAAAAEKLRAALALHRDAEAATASPLWAQSARRLADDFCRRCPAMTDLVHAYRRVPDGHLLHREAAARAVRLYYEVVPQAALLARFDISLVLVAALRRVRMMAAEGDADPRDTALRMAELESLLAIAAYSPGMRWLAKTEGLDLSPFATLARLYVESRPGLAPGRVREILDFVAAEHELAPVHHGGGQPGLAALLEALRLTSPHPSSAGIWAFVDNCAIRCANNAIKYIEMAEDLAAEDPVPAASSVSPVAMAMVEQLPYATAAADADGLQALARFLSVYLACCGLVVGPPRPTLAGKLRRGFVAAFPEGSAAVLMDSAAAAAPERLTLSLPSRKQLTAGEPGESETSQADGGGAEKTAGQPLDSAALAALLDVPLPPDPPHSALLQWMSKPVDDVVDEGYAASLIRLLSSPVTGIRKEAVTNVLKMAAKVRESQYDEKEQVWLLFSELAESSRAAVDAGPVPGPAVAFACHALDVLKDPLHPLYAKINGFLTSGPIWRLDKLPLARAVLEEAPTKDDGYYAEVAWLLRYLLDGLRTAADLSLFRSTRLFERALALAANPYMRQPLRTQVLRLLYRATAIDGGSTTLVTRFGIVAWLDARAAGCGDPGEAATYRALLARAWGTCDRERVASWSKKGVEALAEATP